MEARWLSESVSELSAMAIRDETRELVREELPLLLTAYTKLGFLVSALSGEMTMRQMHDRMEAAE